MYHVLSCVFEQHDMRLVTLASALCLFASITAMSMIWRARAATPLLRDAWLVSGGIAAGFGIWGTHFVAMLAYQSGFEVNYDIKLTALSALIAMTLCGAGFIVTFAKMRPLLGGGITGSAIVAMHYVGMEAVRIPADAIWDWRYVAISVVVGIAIMAGGMAFTIRHDSLKSYAAGGFIFALAIFVMHFTGMSAVVFTFNPTVVVEGFVTEPVTLAVAVAAVAILILGLGLAGAIVDDVISLRSRDEAERLRRHVAELEITKRDLEKTSQDLRRARDAAEAANLAKSTFLAGMSHELRTPLNAVIGFSEMLTTEIFGPLGSERYLGYARDIHGSGIHLLALINDILDLSRIDAGEGKLDEEDLDLSAVISQSLRFVARQAEAGGLVLDSSCESGLPLVRADQRRLKQTLINLLANAVKFTPPKGRITVRAYRCETGIAIAVADTGIGIAAADIPRALERFGQVDSTLARKYEGAGLGLPLAKQFMELHGGTLSLESTLNAGTTVTVTLPAWRAVAAGTRAVA